MDVDVDLSAYLQSSPTDALSVYSNPRSNSSDVSAPITPLSLSDSSDSSSGFSGGAGGFLDLAYPDFSSFAHAGAGGEPLDVGGHSSFGADDDVQAFDGGLDDAFRPKSAPEASFGGGAATYTGAGWDDETPRALGGGERKLSHVGRLLAGVRALSPEVS
ncbi:hypothetical protein C8Q77DRAFT_1045681 [Trametes polyzona]|nr:hypothetical protein C8Q77DRAFT_1045681 [Trametes polyzona]